MGADDAGRSFRRMTRDEFLPKWSELRSRVITYLESTGKRFGAFTDTDFWVVDEEFNIAIVQVEVLDLDLLQPPVIYGLRDLLAEFPDFGITVAVVSPRDAKWPNMGLSIVRDLIVDGLKRAHLPAQYRDLHYEGARPD